VYQRQGKNALFKKKWMVIRKHVALSVRLELHHQHWILLKTGNTPKSVMHNVADSPAKGRA
jgi:hypothetical protein